MSDLKKENFEKDLRDIKNALANPKLYVSSYFEDIINQIDIEAMKWIQKHEDKTEVCDRISKNQTEMINQVKSFESECLSLFIKTFNLFLNE